MDDKVFIVNGELYFPRAEIKKFSRFFSRGYYMDPKNKNIRVDYSGRDIIFESGNYNTNGFKILRKK